MHDFMETAVNVATEAGRLLKTNLGRLHSIEMKGAIDVVTEMDIRAEELIIKILRGVFPTFGILTEESGERAASSEYRWIIDPLDGTTNYAHGYPVFCVSIALEKNGETILGVVYNPMLAELFTAEKGRGACLNNRKIQVSSTTKLNNSLLATGFPYDIRTSSNNNINYFTNFAVRVQAIRRAGSAALDSCYVACGRFDGFWELKLKPWDVAAGGLIVKEAGGILSDFKGNPFSIYSHETVASNGIIHKQMIEVLNL
ncbi:MAG: inositol monophosphatase [Deltaproteobacteria bacterium GWC2_42_11]|nr:MAG: inositol monophosphatase [Deltaproteobacteria bacterium GWC2_42_11]HBO84501.1 inositol monophosphatase [Deltaproteobacteria bacterium]